MEPKPCGLIAVVPPALQEEWAAKFASLARDFRPAALILTEPDAATVGKVIAAAKPLDLAVLVANDCGLALKAGANGVYLAEGADAGKTRVLLGSAGIVGAACGLSRHAAMEAAEAGADFVAFDAQAPSDWDKAAELSEWWDDVTGVPSALVLGSERPDKSVLVTARPDFLLIKEAGLAGESLTFATELGLQSQQ